MEYLFFFLLTTGKETFVEMLTLVYAMARLWVAMMVMMRLVVHAVGMMVIVVELPRPARRSIHRHMVATVLPWTIEVVFHTIMMRVETIVVIDMRRSVR